MILRRRSFYALQMRGPCSEGFAVIHWSESSVNCSLGVDDILDESIKVFQARTWGIEDLSGRASVACKIIEL